MDLSQFALAEDAQTDGAWIAPSFGETLEFLVVAESPKLKTRRLRAMRDLAKIYGEVFAIPSHVEAARLAQAFFEEGAVRGVRGLFHDPAKTRPVTFEELRQIVADRRFAPLYDAMKQAVELAGARRQSDVEAALGNSGMSSSPAAPAPASMLSSPAATPTP